MAKGQKRSNKEPKKPKADKKKVLATAGTVASTMAKPKAADAAGGGKKWRPFLSPGELRKPIVRVTPGYPMRLVSHRSSVLQ